MIAPAELALLRTHWHPVATSAAIDAGPVGVTLLGDQLVVYRFEGEVTVAADRCPHRGSPLSLGTYETDGLACPYHGLRFSSDGSCVSFPARPDARLPKRLNLDLVRSREQHGLVWVCLGEPVAEPPDWSSFDPPNRQRFQSQPARWNVSGSRVAENFNDVAHFSTIHAETFGPSERPVGAQTIKETTEGFTSEVGVYQQYRNTLDGAVEEVEASYRYDFTFPFSSMLTITYPDGEVESVQMTAMPESESSSLVFQQSVRTNLGDEPLEAWRDFQTAVNEEDRVICESLRPSAVLFSLQDLGEIALPTDVFSVAYRQRWRSLLAAE